MKPTNDDPIIAEVRAARQALMEEVGNDISKLFERLKRQQAESDREHVQYPPKRVQAPPIGPTSRSSAS